MNKSGLISAASLILVSACTANGTELDTDLTIDAPQTWSMQDAKDGDVQNGWLSAIGDPQLSALVRLALESNLDLAEARGRLNRARALQRRSRSAQLPAIGAVASGQQNEGPGVGNDTNVYSASLTASWELDLWGRLSEQTQASTLAKESSEADLRSVQHLIAASTAQAYFLLIETNRLEGVQRSNLASLEETLGFVSIQFERGLRSSEDIALIRADVETARAALDQAAQAKRDAARAVEILLGRYPAAHQTISQTPPARPKQIAPGTPISLLERRPDIRAAKLQILAAHARLGSARADLLPRLTSQATFDGSSSTVEDLFDPSALAASFILKGTQTLFDGGERRSRINAASADVEIALAAYQSLVLDAYNEVESELDRGAVLEKREQHLTLALQEAEDALRFSRFRYELGESDLLNVLSIQQRVASLQAELARTQRARLDQYVSLALALGSDV